MLTRITMVLTIAVALFALSNLSSCLGPSDELSMEYAAGYSPDEFENRIASRLYENAKARACVDQHWSKINVGVSLAKVLELCGEPDVRVSLWSDKSPTIHTALFYAVKARGDLYKGEDLEQRVIFYFDDSGNLYFADPLNLGVDPVGSPASGHKLIWMFR